MIKPAKPRARIAEDAVGMRIVIPVRRNWFLVLFLGVWLCGWVIGEAAAITLFGAAPSPGAPPLLFVLVWLAGWTAGGVYALVMWLWNAAGREVLLLSGTALTQRYEIGPLARTRRFDLTAVRDLRALPSPFGGWTWMSSSRAWNAGPGSIAFDYGARTYRIGSGLDEAEARQVVAAINRRYGWPDGIGGWFA